ncbi:MAG: hypothetical protein AAGK17_05635 [Pseudomonadota bacterium]
MTRRWLLGLAAFCAGAPAAALDFPTFDPCTIEVDESAAPIQLTRFDREDGSAYFYSSSEAGLLSKNAAGLKTFLVRKPGAGDWQLWLMHDVWSLRYLIPNDAVLVAGERRDADQDKILGKLEQTGGPELLKLDPDRLIDIAGKKTKLPLTFRRPDRSGRLGLRKYTPTTLDVARLKVLLDWVRYLEAAGQSDLSACTEKPVAQPNFLDPRQYDHCRLSSNTERYTATWFDRGYLRPQWQRRFFSWGNMNADRGLKVEQFRNALATERAPGKPVILGRLVPIRITLDIYNILDRAGLPQSEQGKVRIRLVKGEHSVEFTGLEQSRMKWEQLEPFYVGPGDLSVSVLCSAGVVLETGTIPEGAVMVGDRIIRDQIEQLAHMLSDPLKHCELPPVIIVT